MEMGGGGGGEMSPQCLSCQCFLCRWGRRSAKSLSPTHTDTHASLYNGCFTLVPERERLRQREGDMVRRRKRDMGEGGYWKKKETAMRYREKELKKMPQRLRQWSRGKCSREMDTQTDRRTDGNIHQVIRPIKRGNRRDSLGAI